MTAPVDPAAPKSVFDAAKSVSETLAGMQKTAQEQVLRWVAESLGIQLGSSPAGPHGATPYAPPPPGAGRPMSPPVTDRPKDIKTFVEEKKPKSDNQYTAVVAYYYRFEAPEGQQRETITAEALQESTRQSGWRRLTAPRVTLHQAMTQGYIDRTGRGEYRINTVGENLVAMTLPSGAEDGASRVRARAGRKKTGNQKSTKKRKAKSG
jgi:hypothetical protein